MRLTYSRITAFLGIEFNPVSHFEKIISATGGFIGILLISWVSQYFIGATETPLIVASMGASAVLLFAVPHGALSQPWPLIGGHLISAIIGVSCVKLLAHVFIAGALAVSLSIAAMHYLRCIHPPGGATALTAVVGGEGVHALGYQYVVAPVLLNVVVILSTAILVNYLFPWRRYPARLMPKLSAKQPEEQSALSLDDLEYALQQFDSFIDVTEEDLAKIYILATQHSQTMHLDPAQIKSDHYYSNGRYSKQWAIRQVIAESPAASEVTYKIVAGLDRRHVATCTREEFAKWAECEVFRNENSWQRVE